MWDLDTIVRINQKAAQQAREGKPERDALFLVTRSPDPSKPNLLTKDQGEVITLPQPCACCKVG